MPIDKPSIAVLPFANMSGDPEQEYFAGGMVEENTTQNPDPSVSADFQVRPRVQVDSLVDFFGLTVNRLLQLKFILVGFTHAAVGFRRVSPAFGNDPSTCGEPATSADTDPTMG